MYAISGDSDIKPIPVKGLLEEMFLKVRDSLSCNQYSILTVASTQRYSVQIVIFKWSALKQTCRFFKKKIRICFITKTSFIIHGVSFSPCYQFYVLSGGIINLGLVG